MSALTILVAFGFLVLVMSEIILIAPALVIGWVMTILKSKNYHRNTAHIKNINGNYVCPISIDLPSQTICPEPRQENVGKWCINFPNSSSFSDYLTIPAYLLVGSWYVNPFFRAIIKGGFGR